MTIEDRADNSPSIVTLDSVASDNPRLIDLAFQRTNVLGSAGSAAVCRLLSGETVEEVRDLFEEGIGFLERVERDVRLCLEGVDEVPQGEKFYPYNHYNPREVVQDYLEYELRGRGLEISGAAEILRQRSQDLLGTFRNILSGTKLSEEELTNLLKTFLDLQDPYLRLGGQAHSKAMRLAGPPF